MLPPNVDQRYEYILKRYKQEINEVVYWLNRALISIGGFKCRCVRKVNISAAELGYYQVGKVFRY